MLHTELKQIAHIETCYREKFGIPRQSGLVTELVAKIKFEPTYRNPDALRGIEGYSHLWLLWYFSEATVHGQWQPMVRPPRLGGNTPMGVFATRSPYRPNPIGLSSVRLVGVDHSDRDGSILLVDGADLLDGTPILDIKPYLSYTDSHPDARCGFSDQVADYRLEVCIPAEIESKIPPQYRKPLRMLLQQDPRPSYHDDPQKPYGIAFAGFDVRFKVCNGCLTVFDILPENAPKCR